MPQPHRSTPPVRPTVWTRSLVTTLAFVLTAAAASAQQVPLPGSSIPKFVDALPKPARLDGTHTFPGSPIVVRLEEFQQKVLPASIYSGLAAPYRGGTYVWSYCIPGKARTYPGATIEARRGRPTSVKFVNNLRGAGGSPPFLQSLINVDQTMHWADPLGQHGSMAAYVGPVPAVAHLHGAETPSSTDGGPDAWWTPGFAQKGPGFVTDTYTYPNSQEATMLWYHDHTLGATRTTVYAGLAAAYLLRDPFNEPGNLPGGPFDRDADKFGNPFEREIILQDRQFDTNGQLLFPSDGINPDVHPFWVPEFFGDVIVVNGKSWPYMQVEPRRYRLRLVNGSNARFYELHLNDPRVGAPEPKIWQIGTDGGLLDAPVALNAGGPALLIAPGERMDLIIDFSSLAGQNVVMTNLANGPFPDGDPVDPATSGQIMQFRVSRATPGVVDGSLNPARASRLRRNLIERPAAPAQITRALTLNEQMGVNGPLAGFVNNSMWEHAATENLTVGSTEIWEIINLTGDTHPIHLHLVQFQVLGRPDFDIDGYMGVYGMPMEGMGSPLPYSEKSAATGFKLGGNPDVTPFLLGSSMAVDANENGWKDTFRMNPGQVTRVLVRVAPQDANRQSGGTLVAGMNLFDFDPSAGMDVANDGFGYHGGPGYVWHCHILDHEDNDMMRPMMITGTAPAAVAAAGSGVVSATPRASVQLAAAQPNPAVGSARIKFSLASAKDVELTVFDLAGREVATLAQGKFAAGEHVVSWNGADRAGRLVPSGAYMYRLKTGDQAQVRKMLFVR